MKHEGYHRIETGRLVEPRTEVSALAALASGDRDAWRQMMSFPEPDAGTNLGPLSLNEDAEYYLARIEGQLVRLDTINKSGYQHHVEVAGIIRAIQTFVASLRDTLNVSR